MFDGFAPRNLPEAVRPLNTGRFSAALADVVSMPWLRRSSGARKHGCRRSCRLLSTTPCRPPARVTSSSGARRSLPRSTKPGPSGTPTWLCSTPWAFEAVVKAAASDAKLRVPFKEVRAARGKVVRAEPVAALYEQGKVHHSMLKASRRHKRRRTRRIRNPRRRAQRLRGAKTLTHTCARTRAVVLQRCPPACGCGARIGSGG
jgi:hypothetical protein